MAKKQATPKTLAEATPHEIAILASALVRRPTPAVLRTTPPIPCDFVAAVGMLFACSREEAGMIPLDDLRAELSTAVQREHWSALLLASGYRIDLPLEKPLPSAPSQSELRKLRDALKRVGKTAEPKLVLNALKELSDKRQAMKAPRFWACLRVLRELGEYAGHRRKSS